MLISHIPSLYWLVPAMTKKQIGNAQKVLPIAGNINETHTLIFLYICTKISDNTVAIESIHPRLT